MGTDPVRRLAGVAAPRPGELVADLLVEDAWLVDPASGRSGPGSLRIRDGAIAEVRWSLRQVNQLLFLREMARTGRFGPVDGEVPRPH